MMIELHDVTIGQLIKGLSATVDDGQTVCFSGAQGAGKTTLRRFMAYVPQHLSVPDGYDKVPTDYVLLVQQAVLSGKPILVIDEPPYPLDDNAHEAVERLLAQASQRGATIVAAGALTTPNVICL